MNEKSYSIKQFLSLILIYTLNKLIVLLLALAHYHTDAFLRLGLLWDGEHFTRISVEGYHNVSDFAFAPGLPALIYLVSLLGIKPAIAGLIVTNTFGYLLLYIVYKHYGFRASLVLALFPVYVLYSTLNYSEAPAIFLMTLGLFVIKSERYFVGSLIFGLSLIFRYAMVWGVIGLLLYFVIILRKLSIILKSLVALAIPAIIIIAFFYIQGKTPLVYLEAQKAWDAGFKTPIAQLEWILHSWFTQMPWRLKSFPITPFIWLFRNLLFYTLFFYGFLVWIKRREIISSLEVVVGMSMFLPLFFLTGVPVISIPRLLLPAYFLIIPLAKVYFGDDISLAITWTASIAATLVISCWEICSFFG